MSFGLRDSAQCRCFVGGLHVRCFVSDPHAFVATMRPERMAASSAAWSAVVVSA
jgi:hypothetical protein